MMRHCRQCRADAVGLLGEDRSAEFTTDKIMAMEVNYDLDTRKAYQAKVEEERVAKVAAKQEELSTLAGEMSDIKLLVAVATKGSGLINEHFGHAKEFQVYELSHGGREIRRSPPRRSLLPGRLWRRRQPRDDHPRHQRLPRGVRR